MKKADIEKLAQLRGYVISYYEQLERTSPGTSMTKTAEVAYFCESIVSSIDDLLRRHVNFSEK